MNLPYSLQASVATTLEGGEGHTCLPTAAARGWPAGELGASLRAPARGPVCRDPGEHRRGAVCISPSLEEGTGPSEGAESWGRARADVRPRISHPVPEAQRGPWDALPLPGPRSPGLRSRHSQPACPAGGLRHPPPTPAAPPPRGLPDTETTRAAALTLSEFADSVLSAVLSTKLGSFEQCKWVVPNLGP